MYEPMRPGAGELPLLELVAAVPRQIAGGMEVRQQTPENRLGSFGTAGPVRGIRPGPEGKRRLRVCANCSMKRSAACKNGIPRLEGLEIDPPLTAPNDRFGSTPNPSSKADRPNPEFLAAAPSVIAPGLPQGHRGAVGRFPRRRASPGRSRRGAILMCRASHGDFCLRDRSEWGSGNRRWVDLSG